jgi:hypothetical protein
MQTLSPQQLLRVWEVGQFQTLPQRAMTLLAACKSLDSPEELVAMPIGHRDALLLSLREMLFGTRFTGMSRCPDCHGKIEVDFDSSEIKMQSEPTNKSFGVTVGEYQLTCRLPNTSDLFRAMDQRDPAAVRNELLMLCIEVAKYQTLTTAISDLPHDVLEQVAIELGRQDPQADISLALVCPDCRHGWETIFDIVAFVWHELSVEAARLLRDIHEIAAAYSWREADILALSPARRQMYLEILANG